jgi:hypothetical protein
MSVHLQGDMPATQGAQTLLKLYERKFPVNPSSGFHKLQDTLHHTITATGILKNGVYQTCYHIMAHNWHSDKAFSHSEIQI